jgi:outer membrane biosynthesis protein TonB
MSKFSSFIDRHIFGIIAVVAAYVGVFIYFQLETYTEFVPITSFFDGAKIEIPEENIELKPENLEIPADFSAADIKNMGRDQNDKREKSKDKWSENQSTDDVEKSVKDFEKKLFSDASGVAERKRIEEEMNKRKNDPKNTKTNPDKTKTNTNGGNKAYSGDVMVEWNLRSPHQNNNWYVRNPGYTCGYGSSGKVLVQIKVNQNGDVLSAVVGSSSSANACMLEQAVKYAKMSRFIYSSSAPKIQEGSITYTFIAQ